MEWCIVWIAVLLLAAVLEAVTGKLVCIWFIPASVVSAILALFDIPFPWQVAALFVPGLLGIAFGRRYLVNARVSRASRNDLDNIVGEKCTVTEQIDTFAGCGHVRVRGQIWSARGICTDDVFEVGEVLKVVGVEGVKLICRKR